MQNATPVLQGTITPSCASLRAMGSDGQLARLVHLGIEAGKGTLESGMLLAILDEGRKSGTLKGVLRKHLKDRANLSADSVDDFVERLGHAYKCAKVASAYVFTGAIGDADYFAGTVSWFIPVCAIENQWDKDKVAPEARAEMRTRIAGLLKGREAGTQAALDAIWKSVKGEPEPKGDREALNEGKDGPAEESLMAKTDSDEVNALKLRVAELEKANAEFVEHSDAMEKVNAGLTAHNAELLAEKEILCGQVTALETRIANANTCVRTLAEIAADLIGNAGEDQMAAFPSALIGELPEAVRAPIQQCFDARFAALTESEAIAA